MGRLKKDKKVKATEHICLTPDNKDWIDEEKKTLGVATANSVFSLMRRLYTHAVKLRKSKENNG